MEWAEAIDRDGFAVVPDVVAPDAIAGLIAAVEAKGPSPEVLERGGHAYAMRDLLRAVPEARRLAGSAPLRALVRTVLGPGAFVVRGLLFDKTPEANWPVPWHQDSSPAEVPLHRRVVHLEYAADRLPGNVEWSESEVDEVELSPIARRP